MPDHTADGHLANLKTLHLYVMHPCLRIPEILERVCNNLHKGSWILRRSDLDNHLPRSDGATILAVALTCKTFLDPVMTILWREIYNIRPIFLCMDKSLFPDESSDNAEVFGRIWLPLLTDSEMLKNLQGPILQCAINTMNKYTHRVRLLCVYDGALGELPDIPIPTPAYHALNLFFNGQTVVPNLRELIISLHSPSKILPCLNLFFGLNLRVLAIDASFISKTDESTILSLVSLLPIRCPALIVLDIEGDRLSGGLTYIVRENIQIFERLVSLRIPTMDALALRKLATLPSLRDLTISTPPTPEIDRSFDSQLMPMARPSFPSLRKLKIGKFYHLWECIRFFSVLTPVTELIEFSLRCHHDYGYNRWDLEGTGELLRAITRQLSPNTSLLRCIRQRF